METKTEEKKKIETVEIQPPRVKHTARQRKNYSMKKIKKARLEKKIAEKAMSVMMKGIGDAVKVMAKGDVMSAFQRNTLKAKAILAKIVSLQQGAPEPLTMEATELSNKMKMLQERIEERLEILKAIPKSNEYPKETVLEQMTCLAEIYESIEESMETLEENSSSDDDSSGSY